MFFLMDKIIPDPLSFPWQVFEISLQLIVIECQFWIDSGTCSVRKFKEIEDK